eukprot:TRINITY_DN5563_c1_g1_i1.p2 TRINITY_DN5563_c1_g1~~TRINITY_DN5563_c1_g1_i1.p2  ORF type:complete len:121 (+),score=1.41 TRINITY_DN5563_c1_g1_i1:69-431(+)
MPPRRHNPSYQTNKQTEKNQKETIHKPPQKKTSLYRQLQQLNSKTNVYIQTIFVLPKQGKKQFRGSFKVNISVIKLKIYMHEYGIYYLQQFNILQYQIFKFDPFWLQTRMPTPIVTSLEA